MGRRGDDDGPADFSDQLVLPQPHVPTPGTASAATFREQAEIRARERAQERAAKKSVLKDPMDYTADELFLVALAAGVAGDGPVRRSMQARLPPMPRPQQTRALVRLSDRDRVASALGRTGCITTALKVVVPPSERDHLPEYLEAYCAAIVADSGFAKLVRQAMDQAPPGSTRVRDMQGWPMPRSVQQILASFEPSEVECEMMCLALEKVPDWESAAAIAFEGGNGFPLGRAFKAYATRDVEFAARAEEAMERARGLLNATHMSRAIDGTFEEQFHEGRHSGYRRKTDNVQLREVSRVFDPDKWDREKKVSISGKVAHGVVLLPAIPAPQDVGAWADKFKQPAEPPNIIDAEIVSEKPATPEEPTDE